MMMKLNWLDEPTVTAKAILAIVLSAILLLVPCFIVCAIAGAGFSWGWHWFAGG